MTDFINTVHRTPAGGVVMDLITLVNDNGGLARTKEGTLVAVMKPDCRALAALYVNACGVFGMFPIIDGKATSLRKSP